MLIFRMTCSLRSSRHRRIFPLFNPSLEEKRNPRVVVDSRENVGSSGRFHQGGVTRKWLPGGLSLSCLGMHQLSSANARTKRDGQLVTVYPLTTTRITYPTQSSTPLLLTVTSRPFDNTQKVRFLRPIWLTGAWKQMSEPSFISSTPKTFHSCAPTSGLVWFSSCGQPLSSIFIIFIYYWVRFFFFWPFIIKCVCV